MKFSVIGANSFIARNFIETIKKDNHVIYLYDYQEMHLDNFKEYEQINILSKDSVKKINFDVDFIYFFVGKTGSINGFDDFNTFIDINEKALLNVLVAMKEKKSRAKIIFPSTRLVYKGQEKLLTENAPKEFNTIYAINKYSCEQFLKQFNRLYGINYCIFRICVPYGTIIKGATSYGTCDFMLRNAQNEKKIVLYGDGKVRRTITHMIDLCERLYIDGMSNECLNDIYNIGGEDYSLVEMGDLIARKYNAEIQFVSWPIEALKIETGNTVFDDSKLQNIRKHTYRKFIDWINKGE